MSVAPTPPPGGGLSFGEVVPVPASIPEPEPKPRKKASGATIARWVGTGVVGVIALGTLGFASTIGAETERLAKPGIEELGVLKERIVVAEEALEKIPSETTAQRSFQAAINDAGIVAGYQNTLANPVAIQTVDEDGREIRAEKLETQDEANDRVYGTSSRSLAAMFDTNVPNTTQLPISESIDPSIVWFGGLGVSDGRVWESAVGVAYDNLGDIPVIWRLHDVDGGLLAFVESSYKPTQNKFSTPTISISAQGQVVLDGIEESILDEARQSQDESGE